MIKREGTFRNGKLNGHGTERVFKPSTPTECNQEIPRDDSHWVITYEGNFSDNKKTGFGTCYVNGNKIYEGELLDGFRNGIGIMNGEKNRFIKDMIVNTDPDTDSIINTDTDFKNLRTE